MAQPWSAYPCTGFQQQRVKISTQRPYYSRKKIHKYNNFLSPSILKKNLF